MAVGVLPARQPPETVRLGARVCGAHGRCWERWRQRANFAKASSVTVTQGPAGAVGLEPVTEF